MKNVLDYTEEELRSLSKEELVVLLDKAESGEVLYNTKQIVAKTSLNSLYGALSNRYFPLFNQDMARAITGNGRYFIALLAEMIDKRLNEYLGTTDEKFVIYGDTDSNYFSLEKIVKAVPELNGKSKLEITDWIDNFANEKIQTIITESIDIFSSRLNAFEKGAIGADREAIADAAVFGAKKKYFARLYDNEGVRYNPPKQKVTGYDIARSSTPDFIKKKLKEYAIDMILDGSLKDIQNWEMSVKEEFFKQPLETICKASGVSSIDYDLDKDKSIPINSRASISYNNYIKNHNLEDSYPLIESEDNVRLSYLIMPNPFNSNAIAFKDPRFIEQFREFIDFDTNFEKYFRAPLELMTTPAGFDLNQQTEALDEW